MATFVLVHGGWGGGWEWRHVEDALRADGHVAYRPTLTGLGDRRHLGRPETDLTTHVEDIVAFLEAEDLRDVVLTGQSYGGAVVTGVVDRVPGRIGRLIYLDAFVPRSGETVNDLSGARFAERLRSLAATEGDGWQVPVPFTAEELVGEFPIELQAWYLQRTGPQPLRTLEEPMEVTGAGDEVPRAYVSLRPPETNGWVFDVFEDRAREAGWDVRALPVGHDAQVIAPQRLARLLEEIAAVGAVPSATAAEARP